MDGDADRLVYFQLQAAGSGGRGVRLLDGDRIAALAACLVKHFLKGLPDGVSKGMRVSEMCVCVCLCVCACVCVCVWVCGCTLCIHALCLCFAHDV